MANDIQAVVYTDNFGHEYLTGMNAEVVSQLTGAGGSPAKVGGRVAAGADFTLPPLPRQMRPRQVQFTSAGLRPRYIVALSNDAAIWTEAAPTLNIEDSDGLSAAYTKHGTLGEAVRRRAS
jgi:hypothetical protein